MSLFEDNPLKPPDENLHAQISSGQPQEPAPEEPFVHPLAGDPISYAAGTPGQPSDLNLPEDLRISWSWVHLLCFVLFAVAVLVIVPSLLAIPYVQGKHLRPEKLQNYLYSIPQFVVGSTFAVFALILFFLYITLSVLPEKPFWRTLGWKKLASDPAAGKGRPWMYFLSGCGLSIFVAVAASRVKDSDHAPIQEFLKSRTGAMLLLAMAVVVAPLVEETIFRGYLYPVLARIISAIAQFFGMEFSSATRTGVVASILTTGLFFGLLHADQLGRNWPLVGLLILVGVIFTFARAWTGTVVASFFLHLGYNSMIALASIIATKGFTHMPPAS
jgi:membrane protease YdiL (CAAX protease family)